MRKLLANGIDPGAHRKAVKAAGIERVANSFESVAREWYSRHKPNWAKNHANRVIGRLENDVFPWLGPMPIAAITAPVLLTILRRIEGCGALETAHRVLGYVDKSFVMPSPLDALSGTFPKICVARYRRLKASTSQR